jgi:hypothetical protein
MVKYAILLLLSLTFLGCTPSNVRRLPIVNEMPARPAGADEAILPGDITSFYPLAVKLTAATPDLVPYWIECSELIDEGCFTLARTKDGGAALFIFTSEGGCPVTDLSKVLSFGGDNRSLDWGFLFDRNGDGWVDYFMYLDGALPVKTEEIADLVPKKPGAKPFDPIEVTSWEQMKLILEHTRLVFTHNADDNFDGKSDGVVAAVRDVDSPGWIYGNAVLRSREFTQEVSEAWRFVTDINTRIGPVQSTFEGFEISFYVDKQPLEASSAILEIINKGVRACRVPKGALPSK